MHYFNIVVLLLVATTTGKVTKVLSYEKLCSITANDESFNSYGTLDRIRTLDIEISAIDKEYQQNWASSKVSLHEAIKPKLMIAAIHTKAIISLAHCDKSDHHTLCDQLLGRQAWLRSTLMRTDERILYLQHKAVTDGYAGILRKEKVEGIGYELELFLVEIVFIMYAENLMRRWGWGVRAGD